MGWDRRQKHTKNKLPPFVPLLIATLDSAAWRTMSHGARSTREFERWNGKKFRRAKTESRAGNPARCVPEMAHTTVPEMAHIKRNKRAGNGAHTAAQGVPEMAHITRLTNHREHSLTATSNLIALGRQRTTKEKGR
jgi:hypothetical protein